MEGPIALGALRERLVYLFPSILLARSEREDPIALGVRTTTASTITEPPPFRSVPVRETFPKTSNFLKKKTSFDLTENRERDMYKYDGHSKPN